MHEQNEEKVKEWGAKEWETDIKHQGAK